MIAAIEVAHIIWLKFFISYRLTITSLTWEFFVDFNLSPVTVTLATVIGIYLKWVHFSCISIFNGLKSFISFVLAFYWENDDYHCAW